MIARSRNVEFYINTWSYVDPASGEAKKDFNVLPCTLGDKSANDILEALAMLLGYKDNESYLTALDTGDVRFRLRSKIAEMQ
jgi:hypothetical protein